MEEHLLGYLMKVLDDDTHRQVELYLETHPEASQKLEQLRQGMTPLAWDADEIEPPPDLVIGTLGLVAEHAVNEKLRPEPEPVRPATTYRFPLWRRLDVLVAASLLLAIAGIGVPWINIAIANQRILACQDKLRTVYTGLKRYSEDNNDEFPSVKQVGYKNPKRNVAGLVMPMLVYKRFLPEDFMAHCPGSSEKMLPRVKYKHAVHHMSDKEFEKLAEQFLPTYGYALGYEDDKGVYHGPTFDSKKLHNHQMALMADENAEDSLLKNSPNHGFRGQNILFQDGHVKFSTIPKSGFLNDDLYCNKDNEQKAGKGISDVVIGHSASRP